MTKLLKKFSWSIVIIACGHMAHAGELGNAFAPDAPEIEDESRRASATALHALELLFRALSVREALEGSAAEVLLESSRLLDEASKRMLALSEQESFPDFDLNDPAAMAILQDEERQVFLEFAQNTNSFRELYRNFADLGIELATTLQRASGTGTDQRLFPALVTTLRRYLTIGNAVSAISEAETKS